jgi:hypothetical protein
MAGTQRLVASGGRFPEGPTSLGGGAFAVVEMQGGVLARVDADGTVGSLADLGGGPNGARSVPTARSTSPTTAVCPREIVRAHVVPEPGREIDEAELREYCRTRIAGYKVPALFVLHDELPRNASGKVLKRELRQL